MSPYPDIDHFLNACDVTAPLDPQKPEEYKYYMNFASVRGDQIIEELKNRIQVADRPTYQLFTGHSGCGKSTELLRLKDELETKNFVVYIDADLEVDIQDLQINDLLLGIAHQISEQSLKDSPENFLQDCFKTFQGLFGQMGKILDKKLEITEIGLSVGLATITTQLRDSSVNSSLRNSLRTYLGVATPAIIGAINGEIINTVKRKLEQQSKRRLIIIVDSLDRLPPTLAESLFLHQGRLLRQLQCDIVFTFPLGLMFSNIFFILSGQFTGKYILPMVPIWLRDGTPNEQGIQLLRQMVLKRAFPNFPNFEEPDLTKRILMIFDSPDSLDELCRKSGGNFRLLLKILQTWILKQINIGLPLKREILEECIKEELNNMKRPLTKDEWNLLREVATTRDLAGEESYQELIYSQFVYEYNDREGLWYKVNPILAEAREMLQK